MDYKITIQRTAELIVSAQTRKQAKKKAAREIITLAKDEIDALFSVQAVSDYEIIDVCECDEDFRVELITLDNEDTLIAALNEAGIAYDDGPDEAIVIDYGDYPAAREAVVREGLELYVQRAFVRHTGGEDNK